MNFQELCAEVVLLTRRPDLSARTESAVRAATLKAHQSDFYYRDLVESSVQFEAPAFIQNFLPREVAPRFRKAKYIREWHGDVNGQPGKFLEHIQIENAFDGYGYTKTGVFYLAGQYMQLRTATPLYRCLFGYYVHPIVIEEGFESWVAADMPYAIIYEACRTIFKSIGLDNEASEFNGLTAEQYTLLRMSYIDDTPIT